jgi:hypothetical protein
MEGERRMNEKQIELFESALLINEKKDIKDHVKDQLNTTFGSKAKTAQIRGAIHEVRKYHKMKDDDLYINKNKMLNAAIGLMRLVLRFRAFALLLNLNFVSLLINRIIDIALFRGELELVKNEAQQYVQLLKSMESEAKDAKDKKKIQESIKKLEKRLNEEDSSFH